MKVFLMRLLVLPWGMAAITALSTLILLLMNVFSVSLAESDSDRDTFPGGRRGGGTHLAPQSRCISTCRD